MSPRFHFRMLALRLVLALLPLLLVQCGGGDDLAALDPPQSAELRWLTFDLNSQVEQLLAQRYHEQYPQITFDRQQRQFGNDIFSASPLPDLVTASLDSNYFQDIRNSRLADLSEVWSEAGLNDRLIPNLQRLVEDPDSGQRFMLPAAFSWAGIYYNRAIFEQLQLQPPQTWEEFIQLCNRLKAAGETPLVITGADSYGYTLWFDYLNLRLNGAAYHRDLLAGRERFDDPRVRRVLETWATLFHQGFVVESPEYINDLAAVNALIRGDNGLLSGEEAAMVLMDTYSISQMPPKFRAELDFFRFPVIDPAVPLAEAVGLLGYVVPRNADHGPEAQRFLIYLSSADAQELLAREVLMEGATFAPARLDIDDDALTAETGKAMTLIQDAPEVVPFSFIAIPGELWAGFELGYRRYLGRDYDPQPYLDALEEARQAAVERGVLGP